MSNGKKKSDREESISLLISRRTLKTINSILSMIVVVAIILVSACSIYAWIDNRNVYQAARSVREDLLQFKPNFEDPEDVMDKFNKLKAINPDVCAWLTIDNTSIDYPVVQGNDNLKYLTTNVYGEYALYGSIFLDTRCKNNFRDPYSLIYGHHMVKNMMFGDLDLFKEEEFFDNNRTGTLILPDRIYNLEIYACLPIYASDKVFDPDFWQDDILKVVEHAEEKALHIYEEIHDRIKNDPTTQILAMSTCSNESSDARTVVLAVMNLYKTF